MDNSLNRDLDCGVAQHCAATGGLRKGDELYSLKFRKDTPSALESAYCRVWNGDSKGACPSGMRIVQDVENWVDVLHHVYEKRGISVEDRRQGRRLAQSPDTGQENRGGPRVKGEYEPNARWEHEDVTTVKAADIARSESTHAHSIGTE